MPCRAESNPTPRRAGAVATQYMSMIVRHTENYGLGSIEVTTTDLVIPSVGLTAISLGTVWGFLSGSEDGWTHGAQDVVDLAFLFFFPERQQEQAADGSCWSSSRVVVT